MNIDGVNIINMYQIYQYINTSLVGNNQVEIKLYMSVRSNTNIENGMPK